MTGLLKSKFVLCFLISYVKCVALQNDFFQNPSIVVGYTLVESQCAT